jgi:hypothetical protein
LPKAKPKGTIYDNTKVKATRSDAMVASQCFCFANVVGKCEHFKNIDYAGYTERFRNLQARHLNALLSLSVWDD